MKMNILLASDHAGYERKEELKRYLQEQNYQVEDLGTTSSDSVDYPEYAIAVGKKVSQNRTSKGILVCGTGIGMSIACNKVKGVRCAKVDNEIEAKLTREHNDANVLALSAQKDFATSKKIVDIFLMTPFSNAERHLRRIKEIQQFEEQTEK